MENIFNPDKTEEMLNLYIGMLIENKFKDEHSKNFCFNKILYCFSNEHLKIGFSTEAIKRLNIDQIEELIEHDSGQFECRVNFITEAIYKKPEINYVFFRNITDKLVFDNLKKVPEAYMYYINNNISKLKKALIIRNIISLKTYKDSVITTYIKGITNNYEDDVFNINNLKILELDKLDLINNSLINNCLTRLDGLGEDLDLMLKMQRNFVRQQHLRCFK